MKQPRPKLDELGQILTWLAVESDADIHDNMNAIYQMIEVARAKIEAIIEERINNSREPY